MSNTPTQASLVLSHVSDARRVPTNEFATQSPSRSTTDESPSLALDAPIEPDPTTMYAYIQGPIYAICLASEVEEIAPLTFYGLRGTWRSLAERPEGSHTANELTQMRDFVRGQCLSLEPWLDSYYESGYSEQEPRQDKGYREWESLTLTGLEERASKFGRAKGKNDIGISVLRDQESLLQLMKAGCEKIDFDEFERNSKAPTTHVSTNESPAS